VFEGDKYEVVKLERGRNKLLIHVNKDKKASSDSA
jgi:hypothetical protein